MKYFLRENTYTREHLGLPENVLYNITFKLKLIFLINKFSNNASLKRQEIVEVLWMGESTWELKRAP